MILNKINTYSDNKDLIILVDKNKKLNDFKFSLQEAEFIEKELERKETLIVLNQYTNWILIQTTDQSKDIYFQKETLRRAGYTLCKFLQGNKIEHITVVDTVHEGSLTLALIEGLTLSNYQFIKYFKDAVQKKSSLNEISIVSENITEKEIQDQSSIVDAVCFARDLVNEPASVLSSVKLSQNIKEMALKTGCDVEVFDKQKIKDLKMGGLLAVNQGSTQPPTFTILEWKPKDAVNSRPLVIIGKGVVYDTGGHSLKPTDGMDTMKCDMSGAAAVASVLIALSRNKVPVYAIALIPSTDNRLSPDAYSPGDIITISDGTTVEVLNTDAEGRLILADAICYANRYEPELIIDIATLTGAAHKAIGTQGLVGMGNAPDQIVKRLVDAGMNEYERIAVFPFWDEYRESLKSEIADIQNIGGDLAGAITAGKFLEHFAKYPYFHLDIAGIAFLKKGDSYRGTGATGAGVRLLYRFLANYTKDKGK